MINTFFKGNREKLYDSVPDNTILLLFAGKEIRKTADEFYGFYADRSFVYMTGIEQKESILVAEKLGGKVNEKLFILPPDAMAERWTGRRLKPEEINEKGLIENTAPLNTFDGYFHRAMLSGKYTNVALDLYKCSAEDRDRESHSFVKNTLCNYPNVNIIDVFPQIRSQRTIKQPCEIEAMREAVKITKAGIEAMMKASKPGMYEYEYKAEFDRELTRRGCLEPAFPSIICAGDNNFCIHYYAYTGQAKDGDMILNDVGAKYDFEGNDVSRGWPCNGKFTERQKLLYQCAYNTSEYMFSIVKPGMEMASVDRIVKEYCFEELKKIGLMDKFENIGKLMWHNGAHHVGFDTHDLTDMERPVTAGEVFCIDVGIYCEEWGIGFRLEDNLLVTEDGCENLTASIPRSIEEIEAVMAK
ncbi:MAG: aminopeptidase P N-terminal domain-containing protein [Clostridia bacterium]|nr:aminopeptidase P N-terminal domain-containing protein [Clostridia bacterium]